MPRATRRPPPTAIRRSARTSRPPVRADEPVSYALPSAAEDDSNAEDEGSTTPNSLPPLVEGRELSVEILDEPPWTSNFHARGHRGQQLAPGDSSEEENGFVLETERTNVDMDSDSESPRSSYLRDHIMLQTFMARVDDPRLTHRERIEILIAEINRIQPPSTNRAGSASLSDVSPGHSTVSTAISSPPSPVGDPILPPIARPLSPGDTNIPEVIPRPPTPGEITISEALYLVTVQTPEEGRTFVQILPAMPGPDHTLITRLSTGMLGRILHRLDHAHIFIGTTSFAADASTNYMHYSFHFRELGSWAEVHDATNPALSLITPVMSTPTRENLLQQRRMAPSTPVYTIYIYHEDVQSVNNPSAVTSAPTVAPVMTHNNLPSLPVAPSTSITVDATHSSLPSLPAPPSTSTSVDGSTVQQVDPVVKQFLRDRFPLRFERISHAQNAPRLGQAYRHVLQEKHIVAICSTLGLDLSSRVFAPVQVDGHTVSYDDVIASAGLKKKTFASARTAVGKARDARRLLAQLFQGSNGPISQTSLTPEIATRFLRLHQVLSVMLVESDLDERFLDDQSGGAEAEALTMRFETFKSDVGQVLDALRPPRSVS